MHEHEHEYSHIQPVETDTLCAIDLSIYSIYLENTIMSSLRNVSIVAWLWCWTLLWVTMMVHAWTTTTTPAAATTTRPDPGRRPMVFPTRIGSSSIRSSTSRSSSSGSTSRSGLKIDTAAPPMTELTEEQRTFVMGYINQHHRLTFNIPMVTTFSPIGIEMAKANVWSGGSYTIVDAVLVDISAIRGMEWNVTIQRRSVPQPQYELVHMSVDAVPNPGRRRDGPFIISPSSSSRIIATTPVDDLVRRLCFCFLLLLVVGVFVSPTQVFESSTTQCLRPTMVL